jgi:hypothetical protein
MADLPCRRSHVPSRARAASDSPALSPSITYVVASVVSGVCCTHRPARCGDNGQEASIARQIECCHYAISGPVAAVDSHSYFLQFDLVAVALISKVCCDFCLFPLSRCRLTEEEATCQSMPTPLCIVGPDKIRESDF